MDRCVKEGRTRRAERSWSRGAATAGVAALALLVGGCDVVNPGQVLDEDLNDPTALQVVVNGVHGDLAHTYRFAAWNMAVMTGEMSGTSAYESRVHHWQGQPTAEHADDYDVIYRSVWVGDAAIDRIRDVLGGEADSSPVAAEAYLWAGYSNRFAGEHLCRAVIDGGAPQDRTVYFDRAEDYFTSAIQIGQTAGAGEVVTAARAGRASVRANVGDWNGALADAELVPTGFIFHVEKDAGDPRRWNQLFYENQNRVNINIRETFFEDYGREAGDSRVQVWTREGFTTADGSGIQVMHRKYTDFGDDIPLSKGHEMRLLEAEYLITQAGDWEAGMEIINDRRAEVGTYLLEASNQEEAFEALKIERGAEMWLESRRGGDLYRWGGTAAGDPIIRHMYERVPDRMPVPQAQRAICFPFSQNLIFTNPNVNGS